MFPYLKSVAILAVTLTLAAPGQLMAMNDFDCNAAKRDDSFAIAATTAPEYASIAADGSRADRAALIADDKKAQSHDQHTTGCWTAVTRVVRSSDRYFLYGVYEEVGTARHGRVHYHTAEHIRDTWRRASGKWLQTESLSYDLTVWINEKLVTYQVLPKRLYGA
jgi:hypothetical protein